MAEKKFYGWTIAVTLWFTYLLSTGLPFYGAAVINAAMAKALQLDKTTIGLGFSMLSVIWGFSSPLTAWLLNRIGLRYTIALGALIIAAGSLMLGLFVNDAMLFLFVFGVVNAFGIGLASNLPTQTGITLWFERKRALVLSLVMTASGIGGFFAPPILNRIIAAGDWHTAWLFVAAACLLAAVLAWIFLRDNPAAVGQWRDGVAAPSGAAAQHEGPQWTPREILRTRVFWQILIAAIAFGAPVSMLVAHAVIHLENLGHSAAEGAWALSTMLLFSVGGRVFGGFLCDRFSPRNIWAVMIAMMAAGLAIFTQATTTTHIMLFAALLGIGFGAAVICWVSLIGRYFGAASFATVMGLQMPINTLATAIAPTLAGVLFDRFGTYSLALWTITGIAVLGALLIIGARPPRAPAVAALA